jgi:hypothetical protein
MMDTVVNHAFITVNAACNAARLQFGLRGVDANLVGDEGCHGYIALEGIDIYPQLIDTPRGEQVGWGVSIDLANGDVHEVCEPFIESPSLLHGKVRHARSIEAAAETAILHLVIERLRGWRESLSVDSLAQEVMNGRF